MFYTTGIDITKDKQMFEFLKNHFEYPIMNSWNRLYSIANNVKLYNLELSGDWYNTLCLLENGEYENLNWLIQEWLYEHPGYEIFFNGRSGGYLILKEKGSNGHVLPDSILNNDTYEEYKDYCKEYYGSVRANRDELVQYTTLICEFDRLCDELRDYCDKLSTLKFEVIEMEKSVERFNTEYEDDLELLGFRQLVCDEAGHVNVEEIITLNSLFEAFMRIADRSKYGYKIKSDESGWLYYTSN